MVAMVRVFLPLAQKGSVVSFSCHSQARRQLSRASRSVIVELGLGWAVSGIQQLPDVVLAEVPCD